MKSEKYIVYLHINKINRKVYVGITSYTNASRRWAHGYKGNPHFQASILKYGFKSGEEHPMYNKVRTEEDKIRISQALSKVVLMLDKKTDEILKEFNSATEAEDYLNAKGHHISCCCNNKRKTAYGYKWKYKEGG